MEAFRKQDFELVLMDGMMLVMDGYEATRAIRAEEEGRPRTPIIAVTANALRGDREKCLAAGMDDHMAKPIDRSGLEATVKRWASTRAS